MFFYIRNKSILDQILEGNKKIIHSHIYYDPDFILRSYKTKKKLY